MPRPLYPRKKPGPDQHPDVPLWRHTSLQLAFLGVVGLAGVFVYHFFLAPPSLSSDPSGTGASGGGFFSAIQKTLFKPKASLELDNAEMNALGIASSSTRSFAGAKAENFREKRRLSALQKYEGIRQQGDERRQRLNDLRTQRNSGVGLELKEALQSLQDADNLGIMKLESLLQRESHPGGHTEGEKLDVLIFAWQNLAEAYSQKQMKEKAKDAYLNMVRLMKERAPADQEPQFNDAIARIGQLDPSATSPGN